MKKLIVYVLVIASLAFLVSGCTSKTEAVTGNEELIQQNVNPTIEAFGVIIAQDVRNVMISFPAVVEEVLVKEGEKVAYEDVLMILDVTEYQAQIENKERELKIARWELERISGTTVRNMQRERIAAIELELKLLKGNLDNSYFHDANVVADFEGVVFDISCQPGDLLVPGKKLFSVMKFDTLTVEANIYEEFIRDVQMGAKVTILPVADKAKQYQGEVIGISAKAVKQNGETVVPIQISIENNDGFLKPNFNVDVLIQR